MGPPGAPQMMGDFFFPPAAGVMPPPGSFQPPPLPHTLLQQQQHPGYKLFDPLEMGSRHQPDRQPDLVPVQAPVRYVGVQRSPSQAGGSVQGGPPQAHSHNHHQHGGSHHSRHSHRGSGGSAGGRAQGPAGSSGGLSSGAKGVQSRQIGGTGPGSINPAQLPRMQAPANEWDRGAPSETSTVIMENSLQNPPKGARLNPMNRCGGKCDCKAPQLRKIPAGGRPPLPPRADR
eukprot:GHVU01067096.1.p1 GENE.GHVU01067096.1~~GHVU01067096.1.p1  ORF type:complete len:231 (-),score=29.87 GHVU01067096.1:884-1576(-)